MEPATPEEPPGASFAALINFLTQDSILSTSPFIFTKIKSKDHLKLIQMLAEAPELRSLTFSPAEGYEELEDEQIDQLCSILSKAKRIQHVAINSRATPETLKLISSLTAENKLCLEGLNLSSNQLDAESLDLIGKMISTTPSDRGLCALDLGGNNIGTEGIKIILSSLEKYPGLKNLTLSKNQLGDEGWVLISKLLENSQNLEVLDLSYIEEPVSEEKTHDPAAVALSKALLANNSLSHLDVSHTNLGLAGWEALSNAVAQSPTLKTLNISYCFGGPLGGTVFAKALATNTSLISVNLSGNAIEDTAGLSLCASLTENKFLENINLLANRLTTVFFESLLEVFRKENKTLRTISFLPKNPSDSPLENECGKDLADAIRSTIKANTIPSDFNQPLYEILNHDELHRSLGSDPSPIPPHMNQPFTVIPYMGSHPHQPLFHSSISLSSPLLSSRPSMDGIPSRSEMIGQNIGDGFNLATSKEFPLHLSKFDVPTEFHLSSSRGSVIPPSLNFEREIHGNDLPSSPEQFSWHHFFLLCGLSNDYAKSYEVLFIDNQIEKAQVMDLDEKSLDRLGIRPIGHQIKILKYVKNSKMF